MKLKNAQSREFSFYYFQQTPPSAFITISYLFLFLIQHIRDGEALSSFYHPPALHHSPFTVLITVKDSMNGEAGATRGDFIADTRETDRYTESIVSSYWFPRSRIFPKSISLSRQCSPYLDRIVAQSYIASNYYIIQRVNTKHVWRSRMPV